ncbi:general secretion pathway protein GspK [Verrucomicrobia bacterium]|nr:general secretion pathway protein GspK [Verrucomicrobiota bacterium]
MDVHQNDAEDTLEIMNIRTSCDPAREQRTQGSVLIVVMWVALGLVTVTLYFAHSMYFEFKAAQNNYEGTQARHAVEGALRYAVYLLANQEESGALPDPETYIAERGEVGEATFWFLGRDDLNNTTTLPFFSIADEGAKLNLNLATQEMLELLPSMPLDFAAAIVDWRDEDEEASEGGGAESDVYARLNPSRLVKNAPFDSVDELMLVHGADPQVVYGEDANMNGLLDPNENDGDRTPPVDDADGILDFGLVEYLTVYGAMPQEEGQDSDSPNNDSEDQQTLMVNVNSASAAVLACLPGMDDQKAQQIVAYRNSLTGLGVDTEWVNEALEEENFSQTEPYLTGAASHYRIDVAAVGRQGKGFRRTQFVVDMTGEEPLIVHRKDLERRGWALGQSLREQLNYDFQQQGQR